MRVDRILESLLEATAAKTAAARRIDRLRDVLHREAIRRHRAEGAAPAWKRAGLGAVRLDGADADAKAYVADRAAFGSWVAERFPTEATAVVRLPAAQLEAALEALSFAGVTVDGSDVEVREAWLRPFLEGLDVEELEPAADGTPTYAVRYVDEAGTLDDVAGVAATKATARLVVTLDGARKRAALEEADAAVEAEGLVDADPEPAYAGGTLAGPGEEPAAAVAYDDSRPGMERVHVTQERAAGLAALKVEDLKRLARRHGLPVSGRREQLLERLVAAGAKAEGSEAAA